MIPKVFAIHLHKHEDWRCSAVFKSLNALCLRAGKQKKLCHHYEYSDEVVLFVWLFIFSNFLFWIFIQRNSLAMFLNGCALTLTSIIRANGCEKNVPSQRTIIMELVRTNDKYFLANSGIAAYCGECDWTTSQHHRKWNETNGKKYAPTLDDKHLSKMISFLLFFTIIQLYFPTKNHLTVTRHSQSIYGDKIQIKRPKDDEFSETRCIKHK